MAAPQASSRLELLQARFQQKQLQEKEQKLLQLYDQQQQRAYQVVQRGSAGSNSSNHGSSISQHTVTRTSTSSHTTSTSQGGKVRQMFDERRQTTVKGIDRSYPLEPLENKPRKQTNGNGVQRNGNLTVNRQSVTVKRVARSDVNSNLNGGKPVVSYHEEITRESFGPSGEQHTDDDEFGNENHVAQYSNGNHRDETRIGEGLNEDTIQKNRMMAKLHLMEYDETLKHRVKNDLESEEFPEDFMVDVPDKLPKQSVTKKLSQAEARLERFKNANAKRSNSIAKNTSTITVPKKRSDPVFPAKSTSSGNEAVKNRTRKVLQKGLDTGKKSPQRGRAEVASVASESVEETLMSSDSERNLRRRSDSPQFFCKESEKSATTYAVDSKNAGRFSPDFSKGRRRRSDSPQFFCKESEKSATTYAVDSKNAGRFSPDFSEGRGRRSESPKFFCKESEKSATTYAIDSKTTRRLSPDFSKDRGRRSESPKFFCKESEKSATTYAIDSKTTRRLSPDFSKDRGRRSESPKFFCKESEKSATTYAIDSKTTRRLSPDFSKDRGRRSESPKFFCKESEKSATTYAIDPKTVGKFSPDFSKDIKRTVVKIEPQRTRTKFTELDQNIRKKSGKSAATMGIDTVDRNIKTNRTSSPESLKAEMIIHKKDQDKINSKPIRSGSLNVFDRLTKERSASPKFFDRESKKPATKMHHDTKDTKFTSKSPEHTEKIVKNRSDSPSVVSRKREASTIHTSKRKSPDSAKRVLRKTNTSPQFFLTDSNRSSTIMLVTPETITKPRTDTAKSEKKARTPGSSMNKSNVAPSSRITESKRRVSEEDINESSKYNIRSSVSRFFSEQCERASRNQDVGTGDSIQSTETGRSSDLSRGSSPVSLKDMETPGPTNRSPPSYCKETEKPGMMIRAGGSSSREISPRSQKIVDSRNGPPEFFCYETERSATTVSLKPKSLKHSIDKRPKSPRSKSSNSTNVQSGDIGCKSLKSSGNVDMAKDTKIATGIGKSSSRGSSPGSMKIGDSRSGTPELFCYKSDKSATTVSLKPKWTKGSMNNRSKSPPLKPSSSTSVQPPGRSSKRPGNFNLSEDVEIIPNIPRKSSRESLPRSQKILDSRSGTPEFFCHETDKSATTVSLKPKWTKDSMNNRPKSPPLKPRSSTSVHPPGRPSKSPVSFSLSEGIEIIPSINQSNNRESSPRSQKVEDSRSGTPEFFCYESEKSATTVSLTPKSTKDSMNDRPKSPPSRPRSSTSVHPPGRSSKSPDFSPPKDSKVTARRGSNNVLRSTRLIRDIIKRQKDESKGDYVSGRVAKESRRAASENADGISSIEGVELKHRSKVDEAEELRANGTVDKRATTPVAPAYELLTPESTPKSSTSTEVDAEIQEITMPDQYIRQEKLQRGQLRSTYSKSSGKASQDSKKSKMENLFTYSVRKSGKKRASLFESSVFEPPKKDHQTTDRRRILGSSGTTDSTRGDEGNSVGSKRNASSIERSCSSSPSPTNGSFSRGSKRGLRENIVNQGNETKVLRSGRQTTSPCQLKDAEARVNSKETIFGESKKQSRSPTPRKQAQILRSIELVRRIMKGSQSEKTETRKEVWKTVISNEVVEKHNATSTFESEIEAGKSESTTESISFTSKRGSSSKDYERTDSVESALRRFDSIDTEAGVASARSSLERSKDRGSMTEERRAVDESRGVGGSVDDSTTISLKALDQADVNAPPSPENKPSRVVLKEASTASEHSAASAGASKTRETRGQKKLAKARDSMEIARIAARSKSPSCRRKLFQDAGSTEETRTGGTRSGCNLDSTSATERLSSRKKGRKSETADSARTPTRLVKCSVSDGTTTKKADKGKTGKTSTGASDPGRSVFAKRLRSIEDIRKSIEDESFHRVATGASSPLESAIASDASRCSSPVQRRASSDDRVGSRKVLSLSKRSENLSGRNEASGDSEGSVKCTTRFFRVTKSPSPDSTKATEVSSRPRRNVPSPPSKSPDTVTRRPSTDFKVQDTKPSKRPVPMKGTEPIGNRKTTTTRKSTDVVDGAILENGLHLRDQTAETKYDNDSPTTKKSDAFVIGFDEQPSKENDGPPRKPLLRKQSTEKQTASTQSGRPSSSVSSTSNGGSMQASVSKGKMASKAKTSISGTSTSKGSASSKGGGSSCGIDSLVPCKMCGRRFAQDRVSLHEQICAKTGQKKRKQFDAKLYRVKGTELEPFARRACHKKPEKSKKPEVKTNWRRKHEDFINAIRSAKQVQAHLAAGGKLSDLPPPPCSDTSDYIQCPHCGRKFNQCAAERHIPKCEHMLHNKPVHLRAPKPRR